MSRTVPNFFIVGAPKTGTTALAHYLSGHPNVFVSNPKEPFYWCRDFPRSKPLHGMTSREAYLKLFEKADRDAHMAVGEGSTTYMQSRVAIRDLMAFNPDAKVIAMLRNPVQVAHGMHGENLRHFTEDEPDFETAWRMQADRADGRRLPKNPRMDHQLQFEDVATFAPQLERLFEFVPESQRLVIIFDDFVSDTRREYLRVLDLLGLEDDGKTDFPKVHAAKAHRNKTVAKLYYDPPALLRGPVDVFKKWLHWQGGAVRELVRSMGSRPQPRTPLRPEFEDELKEVFRPDIERVSELLDRDLTHWVAAKESEMDDRVPAGGPAAAVTV